ncbi:MAG TPA: hypothetical protein VII52_08010 [Gemmatimonadaceae bacterium]
MLGSRYRRLALATALATTTSGCTSPFAVDCTTQAVPSFSITVVDESSLDPIGAGSTLSWTGAATGSSSIDATNTGHNSFALDGPFEVAGSFQLRVTHAGYADWTRAVRISRDECHVRTGRVTAQMVPADTALSAARR